MSVCPAVLCGWLSDRLVTQYLFILAISETEEEEVVVPATVPYRQPPHSLLTVRKCPVDDNGCVQQTSGTQARWSSRNP